MNICKYTCISYTIINKKYVYNRIEVNILIKIGLSN